MVLIMLLVVFVMIIFFIVFLPVYVENPEFEIGDIVSRKTSDDPFEANAVFYHISDKKKDKYGKWWYMCYISDKDGNHIIHNADSKTFWGTGVEKIGYKRIELKRKNIN